MVSIIEAVVVRTPPSSGGGSFNLLGLLVFLGVATLVGLQFRGRRRQRWLGRGRAVKPVFAYLAADGRAIGRRIFLVARPPKLTEEDERRLQGED